MNISIAHDFSPTPGGRFNRDGAYSGEAFRDRILVPAVRAGEAIKIDLNGVAGLPSSFLEEAFGGLFRADPELDYRALANRMTFNATDPGLQPYVQLIDRYMREAAAQQPA